MTNSAFQSPTVLRIERTFRAPAQAVFEAWTSLKVLTRWWHPGADWSTPTAEVDLRVGGRVRVVMRDPDGEDHGGGGEYTEVAPPDRLAFTWIWDDDPPGQRALIELEFTEHHGETTVVLTHSGLRSIESRDGHQDGWQKALDNLGRTLAA
jgi:uncharacterized protein YndB with AHSA1/START domain